MIGKKINELATELAPASTDLTIIGNPTTGVSKKITLAQLGAIFSGAVSFYTNYASFPATGTTDVIFCAKDTQKLYLWNGSAYVEVFPSQALLDTYQLRSEKGVSNGYASLDSSGKVPVSQLPSSIMEYKGTWSAATNTPTLANGTGDTGDVYICNAAGSVNFGAGSITFAVGDYVIYSGSIWQRSSGAVGTVTSVGASITGNALTISGSPVTTSGTLAFAFAGTGAQYIKGDGTLATFPSIISQAQNLVSEVYNNTGATLTKGTVVYINGGQGNLPTVTKALATGDSTSAQTYGIVQADITNNNNGYVVVAGRLENMDTQAYTAGTQLYLSSTTAGAYTSTKQYAPAHLVYVGIIVRSHPTQGIIEVKIQNGYELEELHNVAAQTPSNNDGLFWEASTSLWKNKSIATILGYTPQAQLNGTGFVKASGTTISYDNSTYVTTDTTQTITASKTFSVGFNLASAGGTNQISVFQNTNSLFSGSGGTNIFGFNSANNIYFGKGLDNGGVLQWNNSAVRYYTLPDATGTIALVGGSGVGTVTSVALSAPTGFAVSGSPVTSSGTLALAFDTGYSLPTIAKQNNWDTAYNARIVTASSPLSFISNTISISQASGSTSGYLSSTDWTTFNNKQNALTNPVTGTGTTNYLPKFTGTSTIGNSVVYDDGTNIGIGTTSPLVKLHVNGTGTQYFRLSSSTNSTFQQMGATSGGTFLEYKTLYRLVDTDNGTRLTLDASGNLGLGVTPSAWSVTALQVKSAAIFEYANNNISFGSNIYFDGSNRYISSTSASNYQQSGGSHYWYTAPSGTAGNAISFTQAMTLDASGNLGLGNTSPTIASGYRSFIANGTSGTIIRTQVNGTTAFDIQADPAITYLWENRNYPIAFGTNSTERMRISASGNLSIGNTNDTYKLDVSGTGRFTGKLIGSSAGFSNRVTVGTDSDQPYVALGIFGSISSGADQWSFLTDNALSGTSTSTAIMANAKIKASTAVTRAIGINITDAEKGSGATITNNYGLYINNQTAGSSLNYAIYTVGGLHYFGGAATFSSSVTAGSTINITGSDGGGKTLYFNGGTTKYNFLIGVQNNVNNALEITPSTAAGGSTYSTPAVVVTSGGLVGIGTTSPSGPLHLSYSSAVYDGMFFTDTRATSSSGTWRIGAGTGGVGFGIYSNSLATTTLFISNSTGAATFSSSIAIGNSVSTAVSVASTHKVSILIGGVQYYLLASNV